MWHLILHVISENFNVETFLRYLQLSGHFVSTSVVYTDWNAWSVDHSQVVMCRTYQRCIYCVSLFFPKLFKPRLIDTIKERNGSYSFKTSPARSSCVGLEKAINHVIVKASEPCWLLRLRILENNLLPITLLDEALRLQLSENRARDISHF